MTATDDNMAANAPDSKTPKRRTMRGWAAASLVGAAVLYAASLHFRLPWVQAFAEAALIGGLADWFAVTALFRRPLGLPIPHTALIPRNRERLAAALGRFVCDNFLAPELISARLRQYAPAARFAEYLARPGRAEHVLRRLRPALARAEIGDLLRLVRPGPPLAAGLRAAMADGLHDRAAERAVQALTGVLHDERESLARKISEGGGKWVPAWVDRRLADLVVQALDSWLRDLADPSHPRRAALQSFLTDLAGRLDADSALHDKLEQLRDRWAGPAVQAWLDGQGGEAALAQAIRKWARGLADDPRRLAGLDRRLDRLVERLIVPNRAEIADFIAQAVRRWDDKQLVDKLESRIGDDLQYIRINGALVGGLAGLALHALTLAAG